MEHLNEQKKTEYLQTTRVRGWVILSAVLILLAVFALWTFTGNMLELQKVKVLATEEGVYGYVSIAQGQPAKLRKGMEVVFDDGGKGVIQKVNQYVYTPEELDTMLGPSLAAQIGVNGLSVLFSINTGDAFSTGTAQDAWVVMGEVTPINLWASGASR